MLRWPESGTPPLLAPQNTVYVLKDFNVLASKRPHFCFNGLF